MSWDDISIRCYETMGVPNTLVKCVACGEAKSFWPGQSARDGFKSDHDAAEHYAKEHVINCG